MDSHFFPHPDGEIPCILMLQDTRLKARDYRLLLALYQLADCSLTVKGVTRKELGLLAGNMAENVVTLMTSRLEKLGWIKKSGNGGHRQPATYTIQKPFSEKKSRTKDDSLASTDAKPIPSLSPRSSLSPTNGEQL